MTDWGEGVEGIKNLAIEQREAFPDYREEIEELIDAGDKIIVVLTIRGTHKGPFRGMAATGKSFEIRDVTICTCRNGKIVRQSGVSDYLAAFVQLGVIDLPGVS